MEVRLGVVVVNFKSADLIKRNLRRCGLGSDVVVAVVDNSDEDSDRRDIADVVAGQPWVLVDGGGNRGFGEGVNRGIARLRLMGCDLALLLNPDAWIEPQDLSRLIDAHRAQPGALITPVVRRPDGRVWFEGGVLTRSGRAVHATTDDPAWLSGACLMMPLTGVSVDFWPGYFLYWEDVDFTYRWRRNVGPLVVDRASTAYHEVGGSQAVAASGKSLTYVRCNSRNRLLFAGRNLGGASFLWWLLTTPNYIARLLRMAPSPRLRALRVAVAGSTAGAVAGARGLCTGRASGGAR